MAKPERKPTPEELEAHKAMEQGQPRCCEPGCGWITVEYCDGCDGSYCKEHQGRSNHWCD